MTNVEIALRRLNNQHIALQCFKTPEDVVAHMGAMQAQDYAGAKWAVGLRMQKSSDALIENAMADGRIIRTHLLRPTWHFVTPADARWIIDLTASRINAFSASRYRQLQLDNPVFAKTNDTLAKALEGGKQLSRAEVLAVLNSAGIKTDELRFIHLLMHAELDKVICSGGRREKQFTYALFDDRIPAAAPPPKEEALAALTLRYFNSRGPATVRDFAWWGGITMADAGLGLGAVKSGLTSATVNGLEFWMSKETENLPGKAPLAYLLPAFDEFAVAYSDRTAIVPTKYVEQARHVIFDPSIIINGQVAGTWKRRLVKQGIDLSLNLFGKINNVQRKCVDAAVARLKKFCGTKS
jgi:hypothetical protein